MELCGVATGGGGWCDGADGAVWHASSTQLRSAFSAVIKEMFMLRMMPRRGERRAQYSTLCMTTLSIHLCIPPQSSSSIVLFPLLMSPSFFLPPLSSHARCIFGSEWQFCTASHCSTATEWWQVPPSTPPNPFLFHKLNLRRGMQRNKEICSHADVYINDGWGPTATQQSFIGKYHILLHDYVIIHQRV